MNTQLKDQWLAALRSGEYPQGHGYLRSEDGYCCLGVLCDIYRKATGEGEWKPVTYEFNGRTRNLIEFALPVSTRPAVYMPPEQITRAVDLDSKVEDAVASMNDSGKSFEEIANYVEQMEARRVPPSGVTLK